MTSFVILLDSTHVCVEHLNNLKVFQVTHKIGDRLSAVSNQKYYSKNFNG